MTALAVCCQMAAIGRMGDVQPAGSGCQLFSEYEFLSAISCSLSLRAAGLCKSLPIRKIPQVVSVLWRVRIPLCPQPVSVTGLCTWNAGRIVAGAFQCHSRLEMANATSSSACRISGCGRLHFPPFFCYAFVGQKPALAVSQSSVRTAIQATVGTDSGPQKLVKTE